MILFLSFVLLGITQASVPDIFCENSEYHIDPGGHNDKILNLFIYLSEDCPKSFYHCLADGNGGWIVEHFTCPSGAVFDPYREKCVWPELVYIT